MFKGYPVSVPKSNLMAIMGAMESKGMEINFVEKLSKFKKHRYGFDSCPEDVYMIHCYLGEMDFSEFGAFVRPFKDWN